VTDRPCRTLKILGVAGTTCMVCLSITQHARRAVDGNTGHLECHESNARAHNELEIDHIFMKFEDKNHTHFCMKFDETNTAKFSIFTRMLCDELEAIILRYK
jgi:hypothetical protein